MYDYNGNTVYLVSNARGATKVAQWRQGKSFAYFEDTITRVEKAEEQCGCQLKGILWHQGEGDTKSTTLGYTTSYFSSLANLIKELRTELNRDVPFIVGQLFDKSYNTKFNDKLKTVDDNSFSEDDVDWVSSDNLTTSWC